jgi:surfeit locus 1 family protein
MKARRVAALITVALLTALFLRAGFWQLDRLRERRSMNAEQLSGLELPEATLSRSVTDLADYRRALAEGKYDHEHQVIVAGRFVDRAPGVYVLTPLQLDDGLTVLVMRGWIAAPDAEGIDLSLVDEPGRVTVRGAIVPPEGGAIWETGADWPLVVRRLAPADLEGRFPPPVFEHIVWQLPEPSLPDRPRRVELPPLSDGPHLGYALQWFSFAIITIIGTLAYALRSRRRIGEGRESGRGSPPTDLSAL